MQALQGSCRLVGGENFIEIFVGFYDALLIDHRLGPQHSFHFSHLLLPVVKLGPLCKPCIAVDILI